MQMMMDRAAAGQPAFGQHAADSDGHFVRFALLLRRLQSIALLLSCSAIAPTAQARRSDPLAHLHVGADGPKRLGPKEAGPSMRQEA